MRLDNSRSSLRSLALRSLRGLALSLPLAGALLVGCTNGAGRFDSGLPDSARLAGLDSIQRATLCVTWRRYMEREIPAEERSQGGCTLLGVALAPDEASCSAARDRCIAESMTAEPEQETCTLASSAACTATVAELEACAPELVDATRGLFATLTCSQAGDREAISRAAESNQPSERCAQLIEDCGGAGDLMM